MLFFMKKRLNHKFMSKSIFHSILTKFRKEAFSERDKGNKFERLMQTYLQTDPIYANQFKNVWLWNDFPSRRDFGGKDTGIDLVTLTHNGDYWAIQCKCFQEDSSIDKPAVDSFLATSSKFFLNQNLETVTFAHRLWISTTNKWGNNAELAIRNQNPSVNRINLHDLTYASVDWVQLEKGLGGEQARLEKKKPRTHQIKAITTTHEHFKFADRGKLIMACGTGKTFTSLKIAEKETNHQGLVLFLVPSIALLGQTLREWADEATHPINAICICSDSEISKKRTQNEDSDGFSAIDLALPASTNTDEILRQFKAIEYQPKGGMTVVFSTYQSIEVIAKAQKKLLHHNPLSIFDLIICDEAHRTTGVTLAAEEESAFLKVHNNDFLKAKKRLYMTATPRLFSDDTKAKANNLEAVLTSMDDTALYGEEIYRIGFGEAVEKDLLSDYKVLILTLSEADVPEAVQKMIADDSNEINSDDASKLIGCINALSKKILGDEGILKATDPDPMRRAVAFCPNIKASKKITSTFNTTAEAYVSSLPNEKRESIVSVNSDHIDGSMSAPLRDEKIAWLKAIPEDSRECRILTNVRCLSEGVDVPSLDAVLFLSARNSQIDVVQSVGRVMRKSPGKKYGYIIIPVVIPSNIEPEKALEDNERYKVVWTVLNALRAHDDRFNATVNKIELNRKRPEQIVVGRPEALGYDTGNSSPNTVNEGEAAYSNSNAAENIKRQLALQFEQLQGVVFARMVQKVGDRRYWEQWAKNVAEIAERHIVRITRLTKDSSEHQAAFEEFLQGLKKNINPSISAEEAVEMLSQHIITKPVFEALFDGYSFVKNNPVSVSMQQMLDLLEEQSLDKDTETLQKFYESVKMRAAGIDNAEGKQRIIIELYDKFFKTAFPKMVEKLGIVYTPVEVVDFIIRSVDDVLKKEFNRSLSDENIHILDPFTGTGTFMTRLLQSGLIKPADLPRKYAHELHANEIVLLAYYIAAINIENAYHDALNADDYASFEGICLTDTFQIGEAEDFFSARFPKNSERVMAQQKAPLRVIIGNPPYSIGQKSANDNAQNEDYPKLNKKIENTYVKKSSAGLNKSLYDSYIKAFRWSSDRLDKKHGGIIAFVTNGSWLDGNSTDGFRKSLEQEFSSIYIFNLRGNQRTSGELSRKEGGKIFGSGSRTPVTVTLLIKKPNNDEPAKIFHHDIGDYLSKEEKLDIVKKFGSIGNEKMLWQQLLPNEHGDWLSQRTDVFSTFIPIEPIKKYDVKSKSFFNVYGPGILSSRDVWVSNFSKKIITQNMQCMIDFYNQQQVAYQDALSKNDKIKVEDFINTDAQKISWTRALKNDITKNTKHIYKKDEFRLSSYRPFCKLNLYFDKPFIESAGLSSRFFPKVESKNFVICISPSKNDSLALLLTNQIADYHFNGDTQCFPLYYYEEQENKTQGSLFDKVEQKDYIRREAVTDFILETARKAYGNMVGKEDVFYYVYGVLHSPDYRATFANDLKKMLPRLPLVQEAKDFWAFSKAGRKLADLHLNYENQASAAGIVCTIAPSLEVNYKVEKMRFPSKTQKETIHYNSQISIENIPLEAYEYVVNGKSAIEWVMERYAITTHKD
jgi:predicted helicase